MFAQNRLKVLGNLRAAGVSSGAIYAKGHGVGCRKWTDTEHPFRQESFFFYLTGVDEPDFHIVINVTTGAAHLIAPRRDDDHALWCGPSPTAAQLQSAHGTTSVRYDDELAMVLAECAGGDAVVHVLPGAGVSFEGFSVVEDKLGTAIVEARVIKTPDEIEVMRKAGKISGEAHVALMKATAGGARSEGELDAVFKYECAKRGAPMLAYTPIIAGGLRGATLHYVKNNLPFSSPTAESPCPIVLVDAACEVQCYASDITRCFPVSGKFEGDAKVIYEIVLEMQKRVLAAMKPGVQWENMHRLAAEVALDGLLKAGILQGDRSELLANHIPALFFPHGLGHLLGIDVHDCGGYPKGVERIQEPGIRYLRMRRELKPGMVVTVEPGIYFVNPILDKAIADPAVSRFLNLPVLARFRKNVGGVRIEDDVAITDTGIDNLTGWVPKEVADVEAVMASH
ncbi:peptidase M24, structural domain-containing protein [Zopfochytrium polystomum]|nr:peptidase M24, structural domain-containing protein [Zopfochytrium polystomum]